MDERDRDYICSQSHENGMTKCSDLPAYELHGQPCNLSASDVDLSSWWWNVTNDEASSTLPPHAGCVNWHRYYSSCRPVGNNPFLGAISFDNIGLAWVAIFQVSRRCRNLP